MKLMVAHFTKASGIKVTCATVRTSSSAIRLSRRAPPRRAVLSLSEKAPRR